MASLGTIALGVSSELINTTITGTEPVLEVIGSFNDGSYVSDATNSTHTGTATFDLGNMPADFKFMTTLSIRLRYLCAAAPTNTWNSLTAIIFKSDGVTQLTDLTTVVSGPITATTGTNSSVVAFTGVDTAATLAEWNAAFVELRWNISKVKGGDSIQKRVTAAELTGTYGIDTSVQVHDDVTIDDVPVVKLNRLVIDSAFDTVTITESATPAFTSLPVQITTDDLVIVQEGQESQPKINAHDDVAVTDVPAFNMIIPAVGADNVLAQDVPVVSQILQSMPIAVFDNVLVQEGQQDATGPMPFAFEDVAITESVAFYFSRLNVTGFDLVTVMELPVVFREGGPLGITTFDPVLAEDNFIIPRVSIYINAVDDVSVDDGSRNMEEFDDVVVGEDVTVKLARLVLEVFDPVAVESFAVADGLSLNILDGIGLDEVILTEDWTVLLTTLKVEASEDVALDDAAVTVSVSSIDLTVDVYDDVTALDVVDTLQLNPLLIDENTEILVEEFAATRATVLLIEVNDQVLIEDVPDLRLLPMQLTTAFDVVTVDERVALRITSAGATSAQRGELPVLGAGH